VKEACGGEEERKKEVREEGIARAGRYFISYR